MSTSRITVLFLAARPANLPALKLNTELRTVRNALAGGACRDRFVVEALLDTQVADLQKLLLEHRPAIVHFSGHGNDMGELQLNDTCELALPGQQAALADLFARFQHIVRCVVLNVCHSEAQAQALAARIPCVIAMMGEVEDERARSFAEGFYGALAAGESIGSAFMLGSNRMHLDGGDPRLPLLLPQPYPAAGLVPAADTPPAGDRLAEAQALLAHLPVACVPPVVPLPAGSHVPLAPNALFVGREHELCAVAAVFKDWQLDSLPTAAVGGIGGVGKSQLAVEFAHRWGQYFAGGVYWMSFADGTSVSAEVLNAGSAMLDLPPGFENRDPPGKINAVLQAWCSALPRLLIFDNCEDETLLDRWRPTTGGARVLLTTRRDSFDLTLGVKMIPLQTLLPAESIALLQKFAAGADQASLAAIADELGDLPLALHVAGSYLHTYSQEITAQAYLRQLQSVDPLAHRSFQRTVGRSPTKHEVSVERTFALSYERLDPADPTDMLALGLLSRSAYFAPGEPIPRPLLLASLDLSAADPEAFLVAADALHRLGDLGLLTADEAGRLTLHRLLAHFVLARQTDDTAQAAVEQAVINQAYRINSNRDPRPLGSWSAHLTHITDQALLRGGRSASYLAINFGYYLSMTGDYVAAKRYYEHSLTLREQKYGEMHAETASCHNNLGMLLLTMGDHTGAKQYLERSLAIRKYVLGEKYPDTALSFNNLGRVLHAMGDYDGARCCYERSLSILESIFRCPHPLTAVSLSSLGELLHDTGDYAGARSYLERSLDIREQVLGVQHPDTAASLYGLGVVLQAVGDYAGARVYYERALAIATTAFGPGHRHTQDASRSLADIDRILATP